MHEELREQVWNANIEIRLQGLITLTWGNVSGLDRDKGVFAIKPSGVPYTDMKASDMVVVDLDGRVVDSKLSPSSDTPTHLELYRGFPNIGGIAHTHSRKATVFAQAYRPIPCLGTTHADLFHGEVPVTRVLTRKEIETAYEKATGRVILECFQDLDPIAIPAVLVAGHGPFTWGRNAMEAVETSVTLETIAAMTLDTLQLRPDIAPLPKTILDKHYFRKHGTTAYYGQQKH